MKRVLGLLCCVAGMTFADVRVPTTEAMRAAVSKPSPQYPPVARQMKVAGKVDVEATVSTDGTVESAKAIAGNPLLTPAAVNAVKGWKFNPFTENGQPAKAIVVLSFDFHP